MHRGWLAVLAWWGTGCIDHHCDSRSGDDPPLVSGSVQVTVPNGATSIPAVAVGIGGSRVTDAYWVEGTSGEDSGYCEYPTVPLEGSATVTAEGGESLPLSRSGDGFSGSAPYAPSYTLALRESSGEDHVMMLTMPEPFTITFVVDEPMLEFSNTAGATIPDALPAGVAIDIPVSGVHRATALQVAVSITHTATGDLVLELLKNNMLVKTLFQNEDGLADNLNQTFTLNGSEIVPAGTAPDVNAVWTLRVVDTKAMDTGRVNSLALSFTQDVDVHVESPMPLAGASASIEVFSCKSQSVWYPSPYPSGSSFTLEASRLDPASNYRVTVTRTVSHADDHTLGSASFATYADFVVPNGIPCE